LDNKAVIDTTGNLSGAVLLLKACQPLVARLAAQGVTIKLSKKEESSLLGFRKIEQFGYNERDWSYLRMAGGVKVSGVAALNSCLTRYQAQADKFS
jgi:hypothetical protein